MTTLLTLSRYLILSMMFIATASFASAKVTLDFQNCTNKKITASWDAYNFSFKGEITRDDSAHGSFTVPANGAATKTLWVYIDTIPEGHVKVHFSGVNASFRADQNLNPLGGVNYVATSSKISFEHKANNAIRVFAKNTVRIGC